MDSFDLEDDSGAIVFRDLMTNLFLGFVVIAVLILSAYTPKQGKTEGDRPQNAGMMIEWSWPDGINADVDGWAQAPGDVPVGYSNKGGVVLNYLRDDLGIILDLLPMNYESMYSRGMPAGEYTVNVHLYRYAKGDAIPVKIIVSTKPDTAEPMRQILATNVVLTREGQELTALRFKLDSAGALVPGSVNSLYRPLRSAERKPAGE